MIFLQSLLLWSYCAISLEFGFTQAGISQPASLRVLQCGELGLHPDSAGSSCWQELGIQRQCHPQPLGGGHKSDLVSHCDAVHSAEQGQWEGKWFWTAAGAGRCFID